ncbi:hypothetical protein F5H01DRAFT_413611 [Linnemannia elongata]|nr:hypothetical protein F5H01DRAFT_413611 [Linnemannia elongata]
MHPRKLANNPASPSGKSKPRKRSSTSTPTGTLTPRSLPNTTTSTSSNSPIQQNEPTSPSSWYIGMSVRPPGSVTTFGAHAQSTGNSSGSFSFPSTTQPTSTSFNSGGSQPQPTLLDHPHRTQSIPISFLINPVPQSPRPFTFSSPAPSSPSPPPVELSSADVPLQMDSSSTLSAQSSPQCRLAAPTRPSAPFPRHHDLSSTTSRSLSERRSYSTSSLSILHTRSESSPLATSIVEQTIQPSLDVGNHSAGSPISSSTPSPKRSSIGGPSSPSKTSRVDTSSTTPTGLWPPESTIRGGSISRVRSSSSSKAIKGEQLHQQQVFATEELAPPSPPPRQVSLRRTTNPDLKTTKTGKILHKSKKAGVNKKSTAYNRFLQQKSKYFAKNHPHLTPQQRMKLIAEEWAVSEKNAHTTRRRSRFVTEGSGQQQMSLDLQLPSSSLSSPPPPPAASSSSSSSSSHVVTSSSSSSTTITTNTSSSATSLSFVITASSSNRNRSSRSRSGTSVATPHDQSFFSSTALPREVVPPRVHNPILLSTTTTTTTSRPPDASDAVSQPTTKSSVCIPPLSSPVHRDEGDGGKEEHEE